MLSWSDEMPDDLKSSKKYDALSSEQLTRLADLYSQHGMFDKAAEVRKILLDKDHDRLRYDH